MPDTPPNRSLFAAGIKDARREAPLSHPDRHTAILTETPTPRSLSHPVSKQAAKPARDMITDTRRTDKARTNAEALSADNP